MLPVLPLPYTVCFFVFKIVSYCVAQTDLRLSNLVLVSLVLRSQVWPLFTNRLFGMCIYVYILLQDLL